MPESKGKEGPRLRPFWSGTIAFGLVSLPVSLYVANRGKPVSLRLVDEDGTPLSKRYMCPEDGKLLTNEEIVRGYEIEKNEYVVVTDDELDSLAPEKSQEIDLRRFVDLEQIDPVYFERAYFLAPNQGATKAYRLLARAMEDSGRAGVATFVMRGKEYLVAIISEQGILRAETLRFADELRTPEYVGLPEVEEVDAELVQQFEREIDALGEDELDRSELADRQSRRLLDLVQRKLEEGHDVVAAPEELEPEEGDENEFVDLMQVLKQSLQETEEQSVGAGNSGKRRGKSRAGQGKPEGESGAASAGRGGDDVADTETGRGSLLNRSKAELYEQAKELDISGRSGMTKEELVKALRDSR